MVASLVDFSGYRDFVEINCRQASVALDTDLAQQDLNYGAFPRKNLVQMILLFEKSACSN